jgi:hypothetical protein
MPDRNLGNCPDFVAAHESGSGVRYCGASEVLRNGCERELILSTAWAAQPKPAKPQNAFEMGKQHLNALAAATRLLESLGLGRCASDIAASSCRSRGTYRIGVLGQYRILNAQTSQSALEARRRKDAVAGPPARSQVVR